MNEKQIQELNFWSSLSHQHGNGYIAFRHLELEDKTKHFGETFKNQAGLGLDLGCGLVSVLEKSGKKVVYSDPLMPAYRQLIPSLSEDYLHSDFDDEGILAEDNTFDWIFCVNVIDHTPDADFLLSEIKRALKPRGTFYFEVNFDPALYGPHYSIWNMEKVNSLPFTLISEVTELVPEHGQTRFWGIYKNEK